MCRIICPQLDHGFVTHRIPQQVSVGEGQMDIYSRLAKDRILLLGTDVNDEMANNLVAQVIYALQRVR